MPAAAVPYNMPPHLVGPEGERRRVGLELEFAGMEPQEAAGVVATVLGGEATQDSRFRWSVEVAGLGAFRVELDAQTLTDRTYAGFLRDLGLEPERSALGRWVESSIGRAAQTVVPVEVVTPPIPLSELQRLDALWNALGQAGAIGTRESVLYAFGLHLNPSIASDTPEHLRTHLQAFLLMYDWLAREEKVDVSRRLTPFIFPFPEAYRRAVLAPAFAPDLDGLIATYLEENPTRDRPLDLLPLFAELAPEAIEGRIEHPELVNARPTYHYRLPNCEIGAEAWSPAHAWNRWVELERLAADGKRLQSLAEAYLKTPDLPLRLQSSTWADVVEAKLRDASTAA